MAAGEHHLAATVSQLVAGAGLENIKSMAAGVQAVPASGAQLLLATAGAKLFLDNKTLTAGAEGLLAKHRTAAVGARTQLQVGAQTQLLSTTTAAVGGHWPPATAGHKMCQMTMHIVKQLRTAVI